jgi:hypothetical protein
MYLPTTQLDQAGEGRMFAEKNKDGSYHIGDFQEFLKRVKEIEQQRRRSMQKSRGMER